MNDTASGPVSDQMNGQVSDACALDDDDAPLPSALIAVRPERLGATRAADEEFVAKEVPIALEYNCL